MPTLIFFRKIVFLTLLLSILIFADVISAKKKNRKQKYAQEDISTTTESTQGQYPFYGHASDDSHVGFSYITHYNGDNDKGQDPTSLAMADATNNGFQGTQLSMPIYDNKYESDANAVTEVVFDSRRGHKQYEEDPYSPLHRPSKTLTPLYSYDSAKPSTVQDYENTYSSGNTSSSNYINPTELGQVSSHYGSKLPEVNPFSYGNAHFAPGQSYGNKLSEFKKKKKQAASPPEEHKLEQSQHAVNWNYFNNNPDPTIYAEDHRNFIPQHVTGFNVKSKFKDDISLPAYKSPQYSETNTDDDSSKWNKMPFAEIQTVNSFTKFENHPHSGLQADESFTKWNQTPYLKMGAEESSTKFRNNPHSALRADESIPKRKKKPISDTNPEDSLTKWNQTPYLGMGAEESSTNFKNKPYSALQADGSVPKRKKKPFSDTNPEDSFQKWSQTQYSETKAVDNFPKWTKYAPLSLEHIKFDTPEIEHISLDQARIKHIPMDEPKLVHSKNPETFNPIPMAMSHYNFVTEIPDFKSYASAFGNYNDPMEDSIQAGSGYRNRQKATFHSLPALSMQKPMTVEIPQTILIPVPQPYPIRVPVPRPVAVPVVRELRVPVEKQVPYPVYKHVPYPVEKPVPVPIEKQVAVPVAHPYPVPIPHVRPVFHHSRRLRDQTDSISDYRGHDEDEEWEDLEGIGVASLKKRANPRLRPKRPKLRRARRSRRGNLRRTRRRGPPRYPPKTSLRGSEWRRGKDASRFDQMGADSLKVFDWRQEQDSNVHDHFLDHHLDPEHFIEDHARYHRELDRGRHLLSDYDYHCHRGR